MKKFILILVCLNALVTAALAQQQSVKFYTWRKQDPAFWDAVNQQNLIPGVTVDAVAISRELYEPFIKLQLQSNKAEFFLWKPGASNLKELIEYDFIEAYTDDLSMMNPSAMIASKGPDGMFYGVPFAIQLQSIIVNQKLLNQHKVSGQPSDLDDLTSRFKTLKSNGIAPIHLAGAENWYLAQVVAEVLIAGLVEETFAAELVTGKQCFTSPKYQVIFDVLSEWVEKGFTNSDVTTASYGVMSRNVGLGNSAMAVEGGWMIGPTSMFYKIDPDYKFDFWSVPGASDKVYVLGDGSYQIAKHAQKQEALRKVLRFTTTRKFAELFASKVNELPAYGLDMTIEPGVLKDMAAMAVDKSYSVSLFNEYPLNSGMPTYNSLVTDALKAILNGSQSPRQAAESIQQGLNSWGYVGAKNCA